MLAWQHSGFHVHHGVRLEADDALGMLQLARYAARPPIALDRIQYDAAKKRVQLVSDKRDGPTADTHDFEPLEFLALLLAHVPEYSGRAPVPQRPGTHHPSIPTPKSAISTWLATPAGTSPPGPR